jgi:hypothetical protein
LEARPSTKTLTLLVRSSTWKYCQPFRCAIALTFGILAFLLHRRPAFTYPHHPPIEVADVHHDARDLYEDRTISNRIADVADDASSGEDASVHDLSLAGTVLTVR